MSERDELAQTIATSLDRIFGHREAEPAQQDYKLADDLISAGYRKIFDGECGLSNVKDPYDKEAAEAWMRWANLAMNDEIGAIGAMKQMLTELGYRKESGK